ncbi:unnamed protein product [Triticum turgidum subsp. durum]|uniref:RING-type domain-containing protein n=1 Tax=Triticum turgidum subsp. durum TaxID=4567 RepID=A0A9R1BXR4_TRITD|nr:unnamed protein product [Triticum turgidum subsp. durum]
MPATAADIACIVLYCAFCLLLLGVCYFSNPKPENAEGQGRVAQAAAAPAVQMTAAPVVLRYFPYSTLGRRSSEKKLVCAICLDEFLHREACGQVPACRHFFHRRCVDVWKKSSHSCPLCRHYMATGSERVSAADDMV